MNVIGGAAVELGLQNQGFMAGLAASSNALRNFSSNASVLNKVSLGFTAIGVTAVTAGVEAVKMAANLEQGVNRLRTGAGDTKDSFASLESGILKVSAATGEMTGPLTKSMYEILSSGQRGAQAFATLSAAAKGAVIEQANVEDVANTLSGVMTNYGTKVFGATQYMNGLITAVAHGKITLQDLSTAMGPIDPIAHAMGISFSDLAAAMSTQTNAMIPAERAATGLRFMMQSLEVPTHKAKDAMKAMGLDSIAVAEEMKKSLPDALQMIYDAAKKAGPEGSVPFNRAISDMVGGQRALSTFTALTGEHLKDFAKNADLISASMRKGKGDVDGWTIAQSNLNVQMNKAHAAFDAVLITVGTQLMPLVTDFLSRDVLPAIQQFSDWATHTTTLHDAFQTMLTVIGTVISDTETLIKWFSQGGAQTQFLKEAVIGLGVAIAAVKARQLAMDLLSMADTVKNVAAKAIASFVSGELFDLQGVKGLGGVASAAKGAAVAEEAVGVMAKTTMAGDIVQGSLWSEEALAGIGVSAEASTGKIAAAGATAKVSLAAIGGSLLGIVSAVAGVAIGEFLLADWIKNTFHTEQHVAPQPNWVTHHNPMQDQADALKAANIEAKGLAASLDKAYQDMAALHAQAFKRGELLGDLSDPRVMDQADVHIQQLKSHIDDLKGPVSIGVLTPKVIAARLPVIDLKSHLDDLQKPENISVLTSNVIKARLPVIDLKSHLDDLQKPEVLSIGTHNVDTAQLKVMTLKSHLDDLQRPEALSIGTYSVDAAMLKVINLKSHIDDLSAPVGVSTPISSGSSGGGSRPRYATGILNSPVGHFATVGERGAELMFIPKGASIFPNDQLSSGASPMSGSGGGRETRELHVTLNVNGHEFSEAIVHDMGTALMNHMKLRTGVHL